MSINVWDEFRKSLDAEKDLSTFKYWPICYNIPIYNSDVLSLTEYVLENKRLLTYRPDRETWLGAIVEPFVGHTLESYQRCIRNFDKHPCTAWTLKTINHLLVFEAETKKSIHDYEQIVDFGAGIGETIRVIYSLGYKGDLYICDFPEVYRLSSYYLTQLGIKCTCVDNVKKIPTDKKTLFIATWSLSEVPMKDRKEIVEHFRGHDFLIVSQNYFHEANYHEDTKMWSHALDNRYDNVSYFKNEFPKQSLAVCIYVDHCVKHKHFLENNNSFHVFGISTKKEPVD